MSCYLAHIYTSALNRLTLDTLHRVITYLVSYLRGKLVTESPVLASSSSVVCRLKVLPMSRVPAAEAQLEWLVRFSTNWWDGVQLPPSSLTQVVRVAEPPPPQASSPVCVWSQRDSGRSGREHQGEPSLRRSSTEVQTLPSGCPFRGCPPVTIIAALLLTHNVMVH